MQPILRARQVYERHGSVRSFDADLDAHLRHGFVLSTPDAFAMGRPVASNASEAELAEIGRTFPHADTWLIWSAAGSLVKLVCMLPEPLPLIAFHRTSARRIGPQPLRIYRVNRLADLARCL